MLISIVITLFVAIQDPIIQRFAVRFVGGYLSEKTGADIKVGRIAVSPTLRVFVNDVSVKDLNDNNLAKIGKLRTKIHVGDLLEGKIHLDYVELSDTEANLIQYEGSDDFNFQFLADFFSSDKEKDPNKKSMPIFIDRISLKNIDFQLWNQDKARPSLTEQHAIDYAHLDLNNINLEAKHFALVGDSVYTVVEKLSANEQSGLELKHFQSDVVVCQKGIFLNDMQMETNNSLIHADLNMNYDSFKAFNSFVDSVFFDATIYPTDILLSDVGYFAPVMYEMPNRLHFVGRFSGPIEHFSVNDMDANFGKMTNIKGDLSMHPLDFENGKHVLKVKNMRFSYDDLVNFHIPGKTGTIPLPESLSALETGNIKLDFRGSYNNFDSDITLISNIGSLNATVSRDKQGLTANVFSGNIDAQRINVGMFANTNLVGQLDLNTEFVVTFPKEGNPELDMNGSIYHAELLGNHIDEIVLNGEMRENRFNGKVNVDDDELYLDFNGLIDFSDSKRPKSDFQAVVRNADLHSLKIMKEDSVSVVSTIIYAKMTGFDIDNLEGVLHLDSTVYRDSRGEYFMRSFDARIVNDNLMQRRINLTNDFFDFEMGGKMNFTSLMMALNEYGDSFVHFPIFERNMEKYQEYKLKHDVDQDFYVQLTLKDTQTLSRLFMPSLQIAKNTSLNGTFTSRSRLLNLTARSQYVNINNLSISNIEFKNFNFREASLASLSVGEVAWSNVTNTDTTAYGLDNLTLFSKMFNDTISTRIIWDDVSEEDHNKALIETAFHPHENGGIFSIDKADVLINDTLWQIDPDNFIDLDQNRVQISNVKFGHNEQSISIDGYVPNNVEDTLSLKLNRFNFSLLDFLTMGKGFDVDGYISGTAQVAGLKVNPMVLTDLAVDQLGMNGDLIGDATIQSQWNNKDQSIGVDMGILTSNLQTLSVLGTYYTKRETDNLDFNIGMDSLKLSVITPFMADQISRIQGFGSGNVTVTGSLKEPQMKGSLSVKNGGCKVAYLNTFYTFEPTILLDSKTIELRDMVLTDTLGHTAQVEGRITHNYLKDFNLDLKLYPRDFLVMATTLKDNDSFYGNVIANGLATVKGPVNDIWLDVKAMTRKGTMLTLPLNRVSTVSDSDFIVFVDKTENEGDSLKEFLPLKRKTNFGINLDVDVTNDAAVKIYLPSDIGTLDATGHGNLKVGTSSSESLNLYGNYIINNGRFLLNFKNILTKTFTLKSGGTITWSGSPTDGRINATGVYSVKTSLSSLGIQVDSTSGNSNVNVECLIHLKDALLNPTITFGLNLPNASEDIIQTVYSVLDTTNQSVMSSQAISLLALGSFAYAGSSGSSFNGSLSNVFSGIELEVAKDWNLGVHYYAGTGLNTYDELQIALKTELFENRLIIETNFGVLTDNNATENASNLVGEFDLYYKLLKDGRLMAHFYNHSNYNTNYSSFAFDRLAPYTQGLGLTYSKSFNSFRELFQKKKLTNTGRPLLTAPKTKPTEKP